MGILDALQRILSQLNIRTDVATFIVLYGLCFTRVVIAVSLSPFLGGGSVPARVKAGLSFVIAAILLPVVTAGFKPGEAGPLMLVGLLLKEALVGAVIGFLSQVVFYSVQMAGTVIDTQRGMNQITFFAPQLPGHVSSLGQLKFQAALVVFLAMDGHLHFVQALGRSFAPLPLASFPTFHAGLTPLLEQFGRLTADSLVIAIQISAPVLVALFLVDVGFGCLGKVAGQINVHNESQPVKCLVGLAVFLLAAALIMDRLKVYFTDMLLQIRSITQLVS